MFSGQEPIAKISEDVNSSALPVFESAHDTGSCQEDIKQKKMEGRWYRERFYIDCAMVMFSFFLVSFQIDLRPDNKDIQQATRRRGKALKAKAAASTHNSGRGGEAQALDAKPSTQSPHMLLWLQ